MHYRLDTVWKNWPTSTKTLAVAAFNVIVIACRLCYRLCCITTAKHFAEVVGQCGVGSLLADVSISNPFQIDDSQGSEQRKLWHFSPTEDYYRKYWLDTLKDRSVQDQIMEFLRCWHFSPNASQTNLTSSPCLPEAHGNLRHKSVLNK